MLAVAFLINAFLVFICVMIHYEFLHRVTLWAPKFNIPHRFRIVFGVLSAFIAHTVQVWVFAVAYYMMNMSAFGYLDGNYNGSLLDSVYFSFTTFTTLGFGDIEPEGLLRFTTGIESLTGLLLITWTASFLFMEMTRYWKVK